MSTKLADEERALSGRNFIRRGDRPTRWQRVQQIVLVLFLLGLMCGATAIVLRHLMERFGQM